MQQGGDEGLVRNKAVHIALGVRADGSKEILGLWLEQNEGAKFWLRVMNELKNRGVEDVLIAVVDGLKGFPEAITAVFRRRWCRPASSTCCATASISSPGRIASRSPPRSRAFTGPSTPPPLKPRSAPSRRVSGVRNIRASGKAGGAPGARLSRFTPFPATRLRPNSSSWS